MGDESRPAAAAARIETAVMTYLQQELMPGAAIDPDTDLLSDEGLDSVGALRLASFVAQEFEIVVQPSDFVIENFRTVAAIAAFVDRARARTGGAPDPSIR